MANIILDLCEKILSAPDALVNILSDFLETYDESIAKVIGLILTLVCDIYYFNCAKEVHLLFVLLIPIAGYFIFSYVGYLLVRLFYIVSAATAYAALYFIIIALISAITYGLYQVIIFTNSICSGYCVLQNLF